MIEFIRMTRRLLLCDGTYCGRGNNL